MYMAYSTNPNLPKVRMQAVNLVYQGWSTRKVARYIGVGSGTVSKWMGKDCCYGLRPIPTLSSRPLHHPNQLSEEKIQAILAIRDKHNRCAEIVHQELLKKDIIASLSSVKRVLRRYGRIRKRSPWKRWHFAESRPLALKPGDLVQIDTIHLGPALDNRLYVYTLLDVYSRWAWAKVSLRINAHLSLGFVREAQKQCSFLFAMLQSDHGQEFSTWFTEHIRKRDIAHRHSRVRKPSDNGHLERFNRTLQEECLDKIPQTLYAYRKEIPEYLHYYNTERLHLGINFKTPLECVQAIG